MPLAPAAEARHPCSRVNKPKAERQCFVAIWMDSQEIARGARSRAARLDAVVSEILMSIPKVPNPSALNAGPERVQESRAELLGARQPQSLKPKASTRNPHLERSTPTQVQEAHQAAAAVETARRQQEAESYLSIS